MDATCECVGIDFHPLEPQCHRRCAFPGHGAADPVAFVMVLGHQPLCVYLKLDDCETASLPPKPCREHVVCGADRTCAACSLYPGLLAVKPCTNRQLWKKEVTVPNEVRRREVTIIRRGLPVVCVKASTLHVLQGTTADPGLIFHRKLPRHPTEPMRCLAIHVALSRARRLKNLRSIGLNKDIRRVMEARPPDSLPAQFQKLFHEKEAQTALDADAAMAALGWV